jgi:hypothetical protein
MKSFVFYQITSIDVEGISCSHERTDSTLFSACGGWRRAGGGGILLSGIVLRVGVEGLEEFLDIGVEKRTDLATGRVCSDALAVLLSLKTAEVHVVRGMRKLAAAVVGKGNVTQVGMI